MDSLYRRVSVVLPGEQFEALATVAERQERTPSQQAAYILRRSLARAAAKSNDHAGLDPAGTRDDRGPEAA